MSYALPWDQRVLPASPETVPEDAVLVPRHRTSVVEWSGVWSGRTDDDPEPRGFRTRRVYAEIVPASETSVNVRLLESYDYAAHESWELTADRLPVMRLADRPSSGAAAMTTWLMARYFGDYVSFGPSCTLDMFSVRDEPSSAEHGALYLRYHRPADPTRTHFPLDELDVFLARLPEVTNP